VNSDPGVDRSGACLDDRKPGVAVWQRAASATAGRPETALTHPPWASRSRCRGPAPLRRTFAAELLGRGIDVETVRQLGGMVRSPSSCRTQRVPMSARGGRLRRSTS